MWGALGKFKIVNDFWTFFILRSIYLLITPVTGAVKSILQAVKTLGKFSDYLFWNTNISTSRADDSCRTIFLKKCNPSYKSLSCKSGSNFKRKFEQWHVNISSYISCNLWRLYRNLTSWFIYNSNTCLCILSLYLPLQEKTNFKIIFFINNWYIWCFIWQ